jgi:phosphoribosylaminoimidazole-succinocarboxamide synthase
MVASDRISAFDVILPTPIPGKGQVLTAVSMFWFRRFHHAIANHVDLSEKSLDQVLVHPWEISQVAGRALVVRKLKALPVEAVARGYLIGSGWSDYQRDGSVCGVALPANLRIADVLQEPIFTPARKAVSGSHDENITFDEMVRIVGPELAERVRDITLRLYREAAQYAAERGIIIADTKFEFGLDDDGRLVLMDEVLTPDSSRFWPADHYRPGASPPSFDKQFVRDYLQTLDWDRRAPGPELPAEIVALTAEKYREAWTSLCPPS